MLFKASHFDRMTLKLLLFTPDEDLACKKNEYNLNGLKNKCSDQSTFIS